MPALNRLPRHLASVLFLITFVFAAAFGQGSKMKSPFDRIEDADRDNPKARAQWMMRGREAPRGQSAAMLRLRGHQQKLALRAQRAEAASAIGANQTNISQSGWINLGPTPLATWSGQSYGNVTGRITAVAVDPTDTTGNTVYVGAASGGVWKSTNAAASNPTAVTWTPLTDAQATLATGAISIKSDASVILVGTGEPNNALSNYYGLGFLRSTNGGTSWSLISSANSGAYSLAGLGVSKMAWGTTSGLTNTVVAGLEITAEGIYEGNYNLLAPPGFYRSTDNGQSWNYNVPQDGGIVTPYDGVTDVVFNAAAGAYFGAISFRGIYKSTDGTTWTRLASQPGNINLTNCPVTSDNIVCPMYRGQLAVVPGRNEMYIWFADYNDNDGGIYKSSDGGASWHQVPDNGITNCGDFFGCGPDQAFYDLGLAAVPDGSATDLYAGAVNVFKCKIASGANSCSTIDTNIPSDWINLTHVYGCNPIANISHVHPDQHGLDYEIVGGKAIIYFANDGGVNRALDGYTGLTSGTCTSPNQFDNLNTVTLGSLTQFVSFSIHPTDQNTILGGTQDNGSPATTNATASPSTWYQANFGDGGYNAINPSNPSQWFTEFALPIDISVCNTAPNCDPTTFQSVITDTGNLGGDEGAFYTPYILDPQNPGEMLVGTCRVWRGSTSGGSFTALSNTFDGSVTCPGQGSQIDLVNGLAAGGPNSGGFSNVVYATTQGTGPIAGSSNGEVWATTNAAGGPNLFTNVTGAINPSNYTISSVAIDNFDATGKTAYVGIMGFLGTGTHIWKTTNSGGSWTAFGSTANGLPDAPVNALLTDSSVFPTLLYAGTDVGVFVSSTNSPAWTEVGPVLGQAGYLPNVAVLTLQLFNNAGVKKLRAGTYGRGIWEYDLNATPDFTNVISNPTQTIFPSQTAIFNGTLTALNGYDSAIDLSCTGSGTPPPPTCILNPTEIPAPGTGSYAVTVGGAIGDYSFNAHAAGNDPNRIAHDAPLVLHVVDFALGTPNPNTITVPEGFSGQTTFQVTASGSFTQAVTFSCPNGLPNGATCSFSPNPASPTSANPVTVNLTVSAATNTPTGTTTVKIQGATTNPTATRTTTFQLTVTPPPDFTWSNTGATSHTVLAGQTSQQYAFNAAPKNAQTFIAPVTFNCSFSPTDPTLTNSSCTFNPPSIAAGASATSVTLTIKSIGPNTGTGPSGPQILRHLPPRSGLPLWPLALGLPGLVLAGIAGRKVSYHSGAARMCVTFALLAILIACGGGGGSDAASGGGSPPPLGGISVSPNPANVSLGGTQQFTANKSGVTWALSGANAIGTIDANGLYTAPPTGTTPVTFSVTATEGGDAGSATLNINAVAVSVSPSSPVSVYAAESPNWPPGLTQQQFTASVSNAGNTVVTWAVAGGSANGTVDQTGLYSAPANVPNPPTLNVNATSQADSSKSASGTVQILQPTKLGNFTVTVTASEGGVAHAQQVTLTVQ